MPFDEARVAAAIERALLAHDYGADRAREVAFHMTDWLGDLEDLAAFGQDPEALDSGAVLDLLMAFLVHVPAHLNAAHWFLMDETVTDPFGIGAVEPGASEV